MSTVIKANEGGRLLRRLSTVDLADHLAEAQGVIDQAKQCASQIVFDAEKHVVAHGHATAVEDRGEIDAPAPQGRAPVAV